MRLLWSLPKAVPALLKHLLGYVELAGQDLEQSQRDFGARLLAGAVLVVSGFFVILTACILVLALTWDTPRRVPAIGWMMGVFIVITVFAAVYRSNILRTQAPLLATVRKEWAQDRVIIQHILSPDEE